MSRGGYDESIYVRPADRAEVYGQDGHGFYTYADTAAELAERARRAGKPITLRPSKNPLFTYLDGMNRRRLTALGFYR